MREASGTGPDLVLSSFLSGYCLLRLLQTVVRIMAQFICSAAGIAIFYNSIGLRLRPL